MAWIFFIDYFKEHTIGNSVPTCTRMMSGYGDHILNIFRTSSTCNHQLSMEVVHLIHVILEPGQL